MDVETRDDAVSLWACLKLVSDLQWMLVNRGWQELRHERRHGLTTTESVYQDVRIGNDTARWSEQQREVINPRQFIYVINEPCRVAGTYALLLGPAWLSNTLLWDSRRKDV